MISPTEPALAATDARHAEVVARLQQSEVFRDYQEAFQTATGLPLSLRPAGTAIAPAATRNVSAFCALMARGNQTCVACVQMHARIAAETRGDQGCTLECFAGLNDSMVPIRLGESTIGYLQTGQVMFQAPSEKQYRAALKQLQMLDPGLDATELHGAFFATRVLTRSHYDAMLRLLTSFALHLSTVANELMITAATAEPPAVTRAREFIAAHLGEELSLEQVARAANTSAFYFCKIFKAATGLTFTDYVARARVEKTKELLLNANVRISEAAFAAGFQSLSQFNRVFRRVTGEAPTRYREKLHTVATAA